MSFLTKIHLLLVKIGALLQTPLLLLIRGFWGCQLILTGHGKWIHIDQVAHYFATLNLPAPKLSAMMVASTEMVGGTLLLLGLCSRFAAAALIVLLCGAYYTADREALHAIFTNPDKFFAADPFLFLYAAVIVFCFGPGWLALDTWLFGKKGE